MIFFSADNKSGKMVSVILAAECSISASMQLFCVICFIAIFEGELKMHTIRCFGNGRGIFEVATNEKCVCLEEKHFENCLDVFTVELSRTTAAMN